MNELTTAGRLGRVRATAYSKLTLSLRVAGRPRRRLPRARGAHGLDRRSARRRRGGGGPAPRRCHVRRCTARPRTSPPGTDNLAARAADDAAAPGRAVGARRPAHAAQEDPRRRGPRRRIGRRGGDARRDPTPARVRHRRRRAPRRSVRCIGSDVPFCLTGRRRVDARAAARCSSPWTLPIGVCRSSSRSRRSGSSTPAVYARVGRARRAAARAGSCRRRSASRRHRRAGQRPRARGGGRRAAAGGVPGGARGRRGRAGAAGRERLGVRGARRSRPATSRQYARRVSRSAAACRVTPRGDRGRSACVLGSGLAALLAALPARLLQQLLVLLLPHALAALLDQRTHGGGATLPVRPSGVTSGPANKGSRHSRPRRVWSMQPVGGGVTAARGPLESQVEVRNLAPERPCNAATTVAKVRSDAG